MEEPALYLGTNRLVAQCYYNPTASGITRLHSSSIRILEASAHSIVEQYSEQTRISSNQQQKYISPVQKMTSHTQTSYYQARQRNTRKMPKVNSMELLRIYIGGQDPEKSYPFTRGITTVYGKYNPV